VGRDDAEADAAQLGAALRLVVTFADGAPAFVKAATDHRTAEALRAEHAVYAAIGADFMPRVIAWDDDAPPVIILEDLSAATWQAPWTDARVRRVLTTLERVAATEPPESVPELAAHRAALGGWRRVVADPAPFLALRLCSPRWLEESLETHRVGVPRAAGRHGARSSRRSQ
jgi:hypothetical protein